MTREELIGINAGIVKMVVDNVFIHLSYYSSSFQSNGHDDVFGFDPQGLKQIIGMGRALDSSRFRTYLSMALGKPANDISAMVIGGHGTTMIPLTRLASSMEFQCLNFFQRGVGKVAADTMVGGATLTGFRNINLVCAWSVCCLFSR
jgi:malate dehydrogenase